MAAESLFNVSANNENRSATSTAYRNQALGPKQNRPGYTHPDSRAIRPRTRGDSYPQFIDHRLKSVDRGDHPQTLTSRIHASVHYSSNPASKKSYLFLFDEAIHSLRGSGDLSSVHGASNGMTPAGTRRITERPVMETKLESSAQTQYPSTQHAKHAEPSNNKPPRLVLRKTTFFKSQPCFSIIKRGACELGENCLYSHDPEIISTADIFPMHFVGKGEKSRSTEDRSKRPDPLWTHQPVSSHNRIAPSDTNNSQTNGILKRNDRQPPREEINMDISDKAQRKFAETTHPVNVRIPVGPSCPPRVRENNVRHRPSAASQVPFRSDIPGLRALEPCRDFRRGSCTRGQICPYIHDPISISSPGYKGILWASALEDIWKEEARQRPSSNVFDGSKGNDKSSSGIRQPRVQVPPPTDHASSTSSDRSELSGSTLVNSLKGVSRAHNRAPARKNSAPCLAWKDGHCYRGDTCVYMHDPEVQEAERVRKEKVAQEEAAKTVLRLVFGSTRVTFAAGASIKHVVTGFESCRVLVKNLPSDTSRCELEDLFIASGFSLNQFRVVVLRKASDGIHQVASIIFDNADDGKNAASSLDNKEFKDEILKLQVTSNGKQGEMGEYSRELHALSLSFMAPSMRALAIYPSKEIAKMKAESLDNDYCGGRQVRVALNKQPAGHDPLRYFIPNAAVINGLAVDVSDEEIHRFSDCFSIKRFTPRTFSIPNALKQLQAHMEKVGELQNIEVLETPRYKGKVCIRAHFDTWKQAKKVFDSLVNRDLDYLGGGRLNMFLPHLFQYSLFIPIRQYEAQKSVFSALTNDHGEDEAAHIIVSRLDASYFLRVVGSDKKAVGSLKVRVERLAAGENITCWDRFFLSEEGNEFLERLFKRTHVYVFCDARLSVLKAFGGPDAVEVARKEIKKQLDKLAAMEFAINLKVQSIKFFIRKGVQILREMVGEDNVTFDVSSMPCRITVRGGQDARHALRKLVDESLSEPIRSVRKNKLNQCPICFDDAINPFPLACGHYYCNGCLQHLLTSAINAKQVPLCCIGNQNNCRTPIPIPVIERFLPLVRVNQLLENAFRVFVDQHPQSFRYCSTPDCAQIYRVTKKPAFSQCPSCFAEICSRCHSESHEGLTCDEWALRRDPEEQERLLRRWAQGNSNVKRCPDCRIFIEKVDGCNHMRCLCGAHVCWICRKSFNDGIYEHLNDVHGGAFDLPPIA